MGYGVATSSYQVEGAVEEDGRGATIWDVFCARSGTIADGTNGSVACDSYHRFDDDIDLLTGLGVTAYRFSVAWSRVQPLGSGAVEPRGLDYYERIVDALLAKGIRPFPTLYHWDLPQALEDAGGWPVRETALRFADYAGVVADRLGDRVTHWATMNEPWCAAFLGYAAGVHAPGRREPESALAAAHHLLLGHALGRGAVQQASPTAEVGIVLNPAPVHLDPGGDPGAVDVVDAIQNRIWLDPLADGRYPDVLTAASPVLTEAGLVQGGDLDAIRGSADWLGINYYMPFRIAPSDGAQPPRAYPFAPPFAFAPRPPLTDIGWEVDPVGMTEVLLRAAARLPGVPLRVTENGMACVDQDVDATGRVHDPDRIAYLAAHLAAVEDARTLGAPVLDYLAWSLMDNFEWAEGYRKTFGLVTVDPVTQARTPKASYAWYAERVRG